MGRLNYVASWLDHAHFFQFRAAMLFAPGISARSLRHYLGWSHIQAYADHLHPRVGLQGTLKSLTLGNALLSRLDFVVSVVLLLASGGITTSNDSRVAAGTFGWLVISVFGVMVLFCFALFFGGRSDVPEPAAAGPVLFVPLFDRLAWCFPFWSQRITKEFHHVITSMSLQACHYPWSLYPRGSKLVQFPAVSFCLGGGLICLLGFLTSNCPVCSCRGSRVARQSISIRLFFTSVGCYAILQLPMSALYFHENVVKFGYKVVKLVTRGQTPQVLEFVELRFGASSAGSVRFLIPRSNKPAECCKIQTRIQTKNTIQS